MMHRAKQPSICQTILLLCLLPACVGGKATEDGYPTPKESQAFPMRVHWIFEAEDDLSVPPRPLQGLVVTQYPIRGTLRDRLLALDANSGSLIWQYEPDSSVSFVEHLSGIAGGVLILAGNELVEAIDLKSGRPAWVSTGYLAVASIATSEDTVYVSSQRWVTALEAATGLIKWRNSSLPGYSFQVLYDKEADRVIVPADKYYLLDAQTGKALTVAEVDPYNDPGDCYRDLQLYKGQLYCGPAVYDATTGQLLSWNDFGANNYLWISPIISDTLYLATDAGTVKAVDIETMAQKWEYKPQPRTGSDSPEIISKVAILGSTGYAIADDATLRAFDVTSGNEIGWWQATYVADWRTGTWEYVTIPGVASDGQRLYATFGDKTLYAFGP